MSLHLDVDTGDIGSWIRKPCDYFACLLAELIQQISK